MPTIVLQVGQCGNQLGEALWHNLRLQQQNFVAVGEDLWPREFFHPGSSIKDDVPVPRRICIDTEAKVLAEAGSSSSMGRLPHQHHVLHHSGCGNNWAKGYNSAYAAPGISRATGMFGIESAATCLDVLLESIHREVEACDVLPDFLLLASTSGGTGSGLGSALMEEVAQEYPLSTRGAALVMPSLQGNVTIQSLNTVLALHHLYSSCHALFNLDNAAAMKHIQHQQQQQVDPGGPTASADTLPRNSTTSSIGAARRTAAGRSSTNGGNRSRSSSSPMCLWDVNWHFAESLVGVLWPMDDRSAWHGRGSLQSLVLEPVLCHPVVKMYEVATAVATDAALQLQPQAAWAKNIRSLQSKFPRYSSLHPGDPVTTHALLLLARGMPKIQAPLSTAASPGVCSSRTSHRCPLAVTDRPVVTLSSSRAVQGGTGVGAYFAAAGLHQDIADQDLHEGQQCLAGVFTADAFAAERLVYNTWENAVGGESVAGASNPGSTSSSSRQGPGQHLEQKTVWGPGLGIGHEASSYGRGGCIAVRACPVGVWSVLTGAGTKNPRVGGYSKVVPALTAVAIRSSTGDSLQLLAERALHVVSAGAYCHWYKAQGYSKYELIEAADSMLGVQSCFRSKEQPC